MLNSRSRNIILKVLIGLISLTLFGFQSMPTNIDPSPVKDIAEYTNGWVEVIIFGEASSGPANFTWNQAQVTLPITGYDSQARAKFQGQVFTFAQGSAIQGPISVQAGWPVLWNITGTVAMPPDCTIEMTIDETWYPGFNIGCAPIVGCIADVWPADYFPGVAIHIPWDRAWGEAITGGTALGVPIHLTVIIYHVITGGGSTHPSGIDPLGCEFHVMFPVIPQAEE